MQANGRLTAPPRIEAVLVTNSVCGMSLAGTFFEPWARGIHTGTTLSQASKLRVAACGRTAAAAHAGERRVRKSTQFPPLKFCPHCGRLPHDGAEGSGIERRDPACSARLVEPVKAGASRKQSSMSKEIYISSTPHETRLAIVEKDELTEIYYERENEYTLAGSIYNGRVTRVLPGMQSSFVDIGLERDAFLYITDFMEEAGDSADFDGGEARGARSERPARSEARTEGGAAEARPEGRSEARSEGGAGRGRDRGRGRRDGRQGQRREQEPRATENGDASWEQPGAATNSEASSYRADFVPPEDEVLALIVHEGEGEGEAVGEGAPGADGSRRWRGPPRSQTRSWSRRRGCRRARPRKG